MKRTVFLLTLVLCAFTACARAETVYDRGELYDVMNVYAKPDLLSEHLMTYFSGTPVDVMENVAGQEDEIYAHVRVAGQIEGYAQIWDGYGHETVLFSEEAADVPCGILPMLVANPGGRGIVNLRDRPSRSGRILAEIPNGTTVEVMGVKGARPRGRADRVYAVGFADRAEHGGILAGDGRNVHGFADALVQPERCAAV